MGNYPVGYSGYPAAKEADLIGAIDWADGEADTRALRLGLFGSSTGAAAALRVTACCAAGPWGRSAGCSGGGDEVFMHDPAPRGGCAPPRTAAKLARSTAG